MTAALAGCCICMHDNSCLTNTIMPCSLDQNGARVQNNDQGSALSLSLSPLPPLSLPVSLPPLLPHPLPTVQSWVYNTSPSTPCHHSLHLTAPKNLGLVFPQASTSHFTTPLNRYPHPIHHRNISALLNIQHLKPHYFIILVFIRCVFYLAHSHDYHHYLVVISNTIKHYIYVYIK